MKKVCLAGIGNMGRSILESLEQGSDFSVVGFDSSDKPDWYLSDSDIFIIAVKPQSFDSLCEHISADVSNKLIISIMAGVSTERIKEKLGAERVVRVMPNLALKVKRSVSAWYADSAIDGDDAGDVVKILSSFGKELRVSTEEKIDEATALFGSGPAYFCYLAEALEKSAVNFGFEAESAKELVVELFAGTAELIDSGDKSCSELRTAVTSKGGTTEAAIKSMEAAGFEGMVNEAVHAAKNRAQELNKGNG